MKGSSLDQPDETRPVDKNKIEVIELGAEAMMRATFDPGWRWSESVRRGLREAELIEVGA